MSEKAPQTPLESEDSKKIEEIVEHQQFDARDTRDVAVEELGRFEEEWTDLGGGDIDRIKTKLAEAGDLRTNHETHLDLYEALEDAEEKFYRNYVNAQSSEVSESREDILQQFADKHKNLAACANEAHDTWVAIGGEAVDMASAKLAALDMYTQPGEFNDAILELEDAEAEVTRRLNSHIETPLKSDTEAAPEGERLADFLKAIRTAQEEDAPNLGLLLKQYREILETKSDDEKWIDRHYKIAETPLGLAKAEVQESPKSDFETRIAQFVEAVAEASDNVTNANREASRQTVIEEASANVQARVAANSGQPEAAKPTVIGNVTPARAEGASTTNERDAPKRRKRERKLGKWVASILTPSGWRGRMQARRDFKQAVKDRGTEIYDERYDEFEQGKRGEPSGWLANEDARKELRKEKRGFKKKVREAYRNGKQEAMARQSEKRPKLEVVRDSGEQASAKPIGTPDNPATSPYDETTREFPKPSTATETSSDQRAA